MTRANVKIILGDKKIYGIIESSASPDNIKALVEGAKNMSANLDEFKKTELFEWLNPETISYGKPKEKRAFATYNYFFDFVNNVFQYGDSNTNIETWGVSTKNKKDLF